MRRITSVNSTIEKINEILYNSDKYWQPGDPVYVIKSIESVRDSYDNPCLYFIYYFSTSPEMSLCCTQYKDTETAYKALASEIKSREKAGYCIHWSNDKFSVSVRQ
jgi:hypothetical protein